jgi:hypothetical protein
MEQVEQKKYYTAQEAQEVLGMTYSALRNQVNTGRIKSVTPPGKRQAVYLKEDVDQVVLSKMPAEQKKYYTAKEAQEVLGMTYSALRNQVNAGHIRFMLPPGKRQAIYLKEDVDQLKSDIEVWLIGRHQANIPPARFVKATVEDMPKAVELAAEIFGGLNTIPLEKRIEWVKKNPDIDYLLIQEEQLVGYLTLIPLRLETIEDLLTLKRYAKDLTAEDILMYEPNKPVDIYGMAIGVKPGFSLNQKRLWGERLIQGARKVFLDLGKRGIPIRFIIAHSFTPEGIRLMKHVGFTVTPPKAPGLHNFLIDVDNSGLSFIMEYKEALERWRKECEENPDSSDRELDMKSPVAWHQPTKL